MKKEIKKIKEDELSDVTGGTQGPGSYHENDVNGGIKLPTEDEKKNTVIEKVT